MGRTACTEPQCLYKGALYLYLPCNPLLSLVFKLLLSKETLKGDFIVTTANADIYTCI